LDGLSLEDLLNELSDLFLDSGFNFRSGGPGNTAQDMETLRQAIIEKLVEMGHIPQSMMNEWLEDRTSEGSQELDALVSEIIKRMLEEGWLKTESQLEMGESAGQGYEDDATQSPQFQLTDKSIDFLGFRLLRQLLGSLGRSSLGHHETAHLSTGVEAYQVSKEYEFGDTLNIDISATLMRSIAREGLGKTVNLEYSDLMVQQTEYQSSCATVLLLDTSHSMILYGEDRFTPGKARRTGAVASDPYAVSRRFTSPGVISRLCRRSPYETARPRRCRAISHQHARGIATLPAAF
jgi:Ca-activated chloride channel family protein